MSDNSELSKAIDSSGKAIKWIQGMVAILGVVISAGVSYGITKTKIENQEEATTKQAEKYSELQRNFHDYKEKMQAEKEKLQEEIVSIRIRQAADEEWKKNVIDTLEEIKNDVKKLNNRRSGKR